jgi:cysteinyl-tRNA synthetase
MNITDVGHMSDDDQADGGGEDKMAVAGRRLEEAKKSGKLPAGVEVNPRDPYQVARFYESRFKEDARALGLKLVLDADADPTLMPRATESVPGMIAMVARLIDKGHAYVAGAEGERAVYFRVKSFADYGRLSGNTLERLKEGEGGRIAAANQSQKEHPADFLLWKEDRKHLMKWDSPWGAGYPGWHIECSVMSAARLARGVESLPGNQALIDLHSGGEDNIFPHHECELAQTCCAFNADPRGATYARMWFHPRFLMVNGEKMSKSKGNFFTARDLFAKGHAPAAVRLELIRTHYRSNANFTEQGLADGARMIERWRRFAEQCDAASQAPETPHVAAFREAFTRAMSEDLNVAEAIASLNTFVANCPPGAAAGEALRIADGVLGVISLKGPEAVKTSLGLFKDGLAPDPKVIELLEARKAAKLAKDFKRSDAIRDELLGMGLAIKDVAGGQVEVTRAAGARA